jgi:hypothetical protein
MNFLCDGIVDSLMKQEKIFYIKYYFFHEVIAVFKYTIFKLKIININIYHFSYFITSICKAFLTKHIKLFFFQPQFQPQF